MLSESVLSDSGFCVAGLFFLCLDNSLIDLNSVLRSNSCLVVAVFCALRSSG